MSAPRISALVASYNRPDFIVECVQSLLGGSVRPWEVIVSDDCSPLADDIEAVLAPYVATGDVKWVRQPRNLREPGNRNALVALATGDWTLIIGDDDRLHPRAIELLQREAERAEGVDLLAFGYEVIDELGRRVYGRRAPRELEIGPRTPELAAEVLVSDLFPFWCYHPATFCVRAGVERAHPYRDDLGIGDDLAFMFEFLGAARTLRILPYELLSWRKQYGAASVLQPNQSSSARANLATRAEILRQARAGALRLGRLQEQVCSSVFTRRFLSTPLATDRDIGRADRASLILDASQRREVDDISRHAGVWRRRAAVGRAVRFVRLFGWDGILAMLTVLRERQRYRMSRTWPAAR